MTATPVAAAVGGSRSPALWRGAATIFLSWWMRSHFNLTQRLSMDVLTRDLLSRDVVTYTQCPLPLLMLQASLHRNTVWRPPFSWERESGISGGESSTHVQLPPGTYFIE